MDPDKHERTYWRQFDVELREAAAGDSAETTNGPPKVIGTVIRYGDTTQVTGMDGRKFTERVASGAFGAVGGRRDIIATLHHDRNKLLGRTGGGGLKLTDSPEELRFELELPDTTDGRDAEELIRGRRITGASVSMMVNYDDVDLDAASRAYTIQRAHLNAFGLVDVPAFGDSRIEMRSLDEAVAVEIDGAEKIDAQAAVDDARGRLLRQRLRTAVNQPII